MAGQALFWRALHMGKWRGGFAAGDANDNCSMPSNISIVVVMSTPAFQDAARTNLNARTTRSKFLSRPTAGCWAHCPPHLHCIFGAENGQTSSRETYSLGEYVYVLRNKILGCFAPCLSLVFKIQKLVDFIFIDKASGQCKVRCPAGIFCEVLHIRNIVVQVQPPINMVGASVTACMDMTVPSIFQTRQRGDPSAAVVRRQGQVLIITAAGDNDQSAGCPLSSPGHTPASTGGRGLNAI